MQYEEIVLGFDSKVQQSSHTLHNTFLIALDRIEKKIDSCFTTSTPNITPKETILLQQRRSMNFTFSKYFEESAKVASVQSTDNDSGFVSNTHESNESLNIDKTVTSISCNSSSSQHASVYTISEDALLEKPASVKKVVQNESVYEEFSHLYYLNSVVPSSVQSADDGTQSEVSSSDTSFILPLQSPICVLKEDVQALRCKSNKENVNPNCSSTSQSHINKTIILNQTPKKSIRNTSVDPNASPELFSDVPEFAETSPIKLADSQTKSVKNELTLDSDLVKKVNKALSGILPPPNLTILQITAEEMLCKLRANADLLVLNNCNTNEGNKTFINTDLTSAQITPWPQILELRYHGLHYNCSKLNEDMESLSVKYGQRFVGAETQSSCTVFDAHASLSSPFKRRLAACRSSGSGARWSVKSPGRRLSHLARRRITFSSSSLQMGGGKSVAAVVPSGSAVTAAPAHHSRQILVDSKRFELLVRKKTVSPRKKTPRKSPRKRVRTPSSSTKKLEFKIRKLNNADDIGSFSGGLKATKRALFQSPDKSERISKLQAQIKPSTSGNASLSPWKRRPTPKQALFVSPDQQSNSSTCSSVFSTASDSRLSSSSLSLPRRNLFASPTKKAQRIRLDSGSSNASTSSSAPDTANSNVGLLPRSVSLDNPSSDADDNALLMRVRGEASLGVATVTSLSVHHKKKLQWAVYEALRSQQIGLSHPNFKQYAATLARVTRRFLPNLSSNAPRPEGGTSERMLRIARQHVFAVTKGKTIEEILQQKGVSLT